MRPLRGASVVLERPLTTYQALAPSAHHGSGAPRTINSKRVTRSQEAVAFLCLLTSRSLSPPPHQGSSAVHGSREEPPRSCDTLHLLFCLSVFLHSPVVIVIVYSKTKLQKYYFGSFMFFSFFLIFVSFLLSLQRPGARMGQSGLLCNSQEKNTKASFTSSRGREGSHSHDDNTCLNVHPNMNTFITTQTQSDLI